MKKYYADRKSLNFLRVFSFILITGIIAGLKYLLAYLEGRFPQYFLIPEAAVPELVIRGLILTAAVVYVLFILILLPLWYNSLSYSISSEELVMNAGILNRNRFYMKMSAVQYVTVISTPFSKYTSFNFLAVSAHGGRIVFMFLSRRDASEMAARIRKFAKGIF